MSIRVETKGLENLVEFVEAAGKSIVTSRLLLDMADEGKRAVLQRTSDGRDVDFWPFTEYTQRYKKTRSRLNKGADKVDLRLTGKMLSSIRTDIDLEARSATLYFDKASGQAKKAVAHNEDGLGLGRVTRRFFGIGKEENDRLLVVLRTHLKRVFKW